MHRFILLSLIVVALVASGLRAQPTSPKVYYACYVPGSGTVYRIKEPNTPQTCQSNAHVEFSWTDGANGIHTGDAAGGDLAGTYPNPTVAKLQGRAVSTTAPANAQSLVWDGATSQWKPSAVDHGTLGGLTDDDHSQYLLANGVRQATNGFVVTGTQGVGSALPVSGPGTRLMWYPRKAAFRAGQVIASEWDDANIGEQSIALGYRNTASGHQSTAIGTASTASALNSIALGTLATASGVFSMALSGTATGLGSLALGGTAQSTGDGATAIGPGAKATGLQSTALGAFVDATGNFSMALGRAVSTNGMQGSFIYGDASLTGSVSSAPNQFLVRAAGGTIFYSSANLSTGVSLASGGGAWATISDAGRKENFRDVDGEEVLGKIAAMPIREWNYKAQHDSIRHLGPTAQDFYRAFGLGESETTITTTDIDGINLLASQALARRTAALTRENRALRADVAALREELAAVRRLLDALSSFRGTK